MNFDEFKTFEMRIQKVVSVLIPEPKEFKKQYERFCDKYEQRIGKIKIIRMSNADLVTLIVTLKKSLIVEGNTVSRFIAHIGEYAVIDENEISYVTHEQQIKLAWG